MKTDYWELKFSVEVSAMYHDWRRGSLWSTVRWIKIITLVGAAIALVTAFSAPAMLAHIIAAVSAIIAVVSLFDLVMNLGEGAYRHEELYKRFKHLQAKIDRLGYNAAEQQFAEWQAQAQLIRVDEPPTLWAVYAKCWNQIIERHGTERTGYYRRIAWWQSLIGRIIAFNPQDFPPEPTPATPR